jgi:hypothetical protein
MMSEEHTCSWATPDGCRESWVVPRLWEASKGLPVTEVELDTLEEVTLSYGWLRHCRDDSHPRVITEMERVIDADLSYPIILHPAGWLMDGYHRVARALREGRKTLPAVRFTYRTLPPPSND